jgi:hypothetical protein
MPRNIVSVWGSAGDYLPVAGGSGIDLTLTGANATATTGTSLQISVPSGTVDGNFMLAIVKCRENAGAVSNPITLPSGWTSIVQLYDATNRVTDVHIAYRRASSEPANYTWTCSFDVSGGGNFCGLIWRMSGVIGSGNPEDGTRSSVFDNGAAANFNVAGMTTTAADSAVICLRIHRGAATRCSSETLGGTSITEYFDVDAITACGRIQAAAGATGNWAGTDDDGGNDRYCITLALLKA